MKVKSLFVSMLAIAALASCTQNDDMPGNPTDGGKEARVTLKLKGDGDGATTRATAAVPDAATEKQIDNLSVFIFNKKTGGLVTSKHFEKTEFTVGTPLSITTKTDGDKVVVIANAAANKGEFATLFGTVSSLATLRAVKVNLMEAGTNATNRPIKQEQSGKVLQNGWADITYGADTDANKGSATVQMRFVGARIVVKEISWNGKKSGTFERDPAIFNTDNTKNFTIRDIYLMDASASTHLIPTLTGTTAASPVNPTEGSAVTVNNDYVDLTSRTFGCFEKWGTTPWGTATKDQIESNALGAKYTATTGTLPTVTDLTGSAKSIKSPCWWYVFGNPTTTANRPTILVVKVGWLKGKKGEAYPESTTTTLTADEREDRYFTVYLDGLDRAHVESGKTYDITLKLNGNFLPASGTTGGGGGGGTTDPDKPSVDADVEVTVNTATWRTVGLDKEWN